MSRIFGPVRQLGMVVEQFDQAILTAIERYGIGPFYVVREVTPSWFRYRGLDSQPPVLSLAFAFSGSFQLEIIQQHDEAPSAYRDFLSAGRQGAQHLSSWFPDHEAYDRGYDAAAQAAGTPIHEGQIGHGRFAYFDTVDPVLNLSFEMSEMLLAQSRPLWIRAEQEAADWDGRDPIRNLK